jgi:hypothetical protein
MMEVLWAAIVVGVSLALSRLLLHLQSGCRPERRAMVGLSTTVVHMVVSLVLTGTLLVVFKSDRPLGFVVGVLAFYLFSLIILVVAIVRWMRAASDQSPVTPSGVSDNHNSLTK